MENYLNRFLSDKSFRRKAIRWFFRGKFIYPLHSYIDNLMIRLINSLDIQPRVLCSVCGWKGARFESIATLEYYRPSAKCPNCGSYERHRALFDLLKNQNLIQFPLKYLDIAPVPGIAAYLKSRVQYISIDYGALAADVRGDVRFLPFAKTSFDVIVCFHVLEFVDDWRKALQEFFETLKPHGFLILSENFMFGQTTSVEFDAQKLIGGSPLRRFGYDLPDALKNVGFAVRMWDYLGHNDERGDYFFVCSVTE